MRIWVYGKKQEEVETILKSEIGEETTIMGTSLRSGKDAAFPNGGLTPAVQAAIGGEIDMLLISESALSGRSYATKCELDELFQRYHVSVKSFKSSDSSNS